MAVDCPSTPLGANQHKQWVICLPLLASLIRCPLATWRTSSLQVGDWHDVVMLPVMSPMGGSAAVRFQPG